MPGVIPFGAEGATTAIIPPHTMDTVPAFIDEPLARLMSRQLAAGDPPLWNPFNACGAPLLGNMQSAPLSPFRWPVLCFPTTLWVHDAALLLRMFAAGFFAWLWLAGRGLGSAAAAGGAAAFMLCGYLVLHVSMHHLGVEVLLPAFLYCADRTGSPGARVVAPAALVAVATAAITGGNPESTLVLFLFGAGYVLAHARSYGRSGCLRILAAVVLAAALSLPYLLPAIEYLATSAHHHAGAARAGLDHYRPWTALSYLDARAFAPPGPGGVNPLAPPYLGASVFVLALAGLVRRGHWLPIRFLASAAAILLLKAVGTQPLQLLGELPLLDLLYFYKYGNAPLALSLAALAASGIQRIQHRGVGPLFHPLLVGAGAVALYLWAHSSRGDLPVSVRFPLPALAACGGLAALLFLQSRTRLARTAAALAAAVVAVELLASVPRQRPPRVEVYAPAPYLEAMRAQTRPFRSFGIEDALPPNVNAAVGIADVRSHDGLYVARFDRFVTTLLNPNNHAPQFDGRMLHPDPALEHKLALASYFVSRGLDDVARAHNDFTMDFTSDEKLRGYDLANVRFLLFNPAVADGAAGFARARPDRYRVAHDGRDLFVLENLLALPRAFVARAALPADGPEAAAQALRTIDIDRTVVLEGAAEGLPAVLPPGTPGFRRAPGCEVVSLGPLATRVRLEPGPAGILVLADTFYPGWEAQVDGVATEVLAANLLFRGVRVAEGAREVVFRYRPASWRLGLSGAAAALLALAAWLIVAARARRPAAPR